MFVICFISHWRRDENIKTWTLRLSSKENLTWRRHCSIGQLCCSITSKRSINWFLEPWKLFGHEVFSPERALKQPKATRFCDFCVRVFVVSALFACFHSKVIRNRSKHNMDGGTKQRGGWGEFPIVTSPVSTSLIYANVYMKKNYNNFTWTRELESKLQGPGFLVGFGILDEMQCTKVTTEI